MDRIIFGLHVMVVMLGIMIPFIKDRNFLMLYSIVIPFLFFHWAVNDDTCFLTQLECAVTNKPKERTFMGRLIGPIYNLSDDAAGKLIKCILFGLWLFVQFKLKQITLPPQMDFIYNYSLFKTN